MESEQEKISALERFGREIAKIHERNTKQALKAFLAIKNPTNKNEIAMSKYYEELAEEEVVTRICQNQIEGVLHDIFFLFEEENRQKLIVRTENGIEIDLALEYEELRAKPGDWIEQYSASGWEGGRQVEFYSDYYGLGLA